MTRPAAACAAAVLLSAMAPAIGAGAAPAPRIDLTASGRSVPADPSGTASAARAAEPADRLPVPAGVRKPVPYGPGDATRA
ncbi:hypothetical protein ABVG11_04400 [Streptomyces sp. HD1123-B1]|uniref:hypothetical protein n=1 Tax=Streptomyces TaxID=1883 RepID=UPI003D7E881C